VTASRELEGGELLALGGLMMAYLLIHGHSKERLQINPDEQIVSHDK
jgi:hypothetical protein